MDALALAKEISPDIILLDIGMPSMNGYDVCKELRKDKKFKDVIMITQTGWGQERNKKLAIEAGFDHHLLKPVKFDKFIALMKDIQKAKVS